MKQAELYGQLVTSVGLEAAINSSAELHGAIGSGVERIMQGKAAQVATRYDLPTVGESDAVYFVTEENATYRWDEANLKYYCCGRDYSEIEVINGGELDG